MLGLLASCAPPPTSMQTRDQAQDMSALQTVVDKQGQELQMLSRQLIELQNRQQQQSQEIEQLRQSSQTAGGADQSASLPRTSGTTAMQGQDKGSPTEVYLQAFGDYASGRYQSAVLGFETFLQRFPNNSYASNAQFWLADCYFNQQQYALAIPQFERVLSEYSGAAKNPEALYKIAIAHLQLGATDQARQTVDLLNNRYPKSNATLKAQELVIP
ncbi:MAG: tol-pal system protein YbgF [Desulfuromonadales bacterium]